MDSYKLTLTLTDYLLATTPVRIVDYPGIMQGLAPDELVQEVRGLPQRGKYYMGTFPRIDGKICFPTNNIKAFLKDAWSVMKLVPDSISGTPVYRAGKKRVDTQIFFLPDKAPILLPEGQRESLCRKLVRAHTAVGENLYWSYAEQVPPGSVIECAIMVVAGVLQAALEEWLSYGQLRGFGQWRGSGKGRFTHKIAPLRTGDTSLGRSLAVLVE